MKNTTMKAILNRKRKSPVRTISKLMKIVEEARQQQSTAPATLNTTTKDVIGYLQDRYDMRYNSVMGYVEYKQKNSNSWLPLDERKTNSITMEVQLAGIKAWDRDIKRYIMSEMVTVYNPISQYLDSVTGTWDGTDHIALLANSVKTNCPHWHRWFRTWLLAMVAQWRGMNRMYGNSVAPLLISGQGYNKSTFCRNLLPECLRWGYSDYITTDNKQAMMQAMGQMLLINLDEFNQISPRMQEGFLKNLIQLPSIKAKRPYGKHVEEFPRLASFIATTNISDALADPTGNRRFIGIELLAPIDVSTPIDHDQLYAQIMTLLDSGERYWFDDAETRLIMDHNRCYQQELPVLAYFNEQFEVAQDESNGKWLSTAQLLTMLRKEYGISVIKTSVQAFGRMLANMAGMQRRRTFRGTEYLVRQSPRCPAA